MSSKNTFERMLQTQCPSWSQKKGCIFALEHLKGMVDDMDAKLMKGTPLDDAEQEFYDQVAALDDKISFAKEEMHKQVENGAITKFEKDTLLQHNAERLDTLDGEMKAAEGKKLEKLQAMKAKLLERRQLLESVSPKDPHKLRYEQDIAKLWKEVVPMLKIEDQTKGRLLSVKETQSMARKDEIMEEIENLEEASRGWFEDDEAFDARVEAIRDKFKSQLSNQKSKVGGGGKKSGASVATITGSTTSTVRKDKWITPGEKQKKNVYDPSKKKKKGKGSGVFAAMMIQDSDSDDEDGNDNSDDNDDEQQEKKIVTQDKQSSSQEPSNQKTSGSGGGGKKKGGKKKNKKSKGGNDKKGTEMSEDELLNSAASANQAAKKKEQEDQESSHSIINFIRNYLIPFILAIITWIASLFVGKSKTNRKKD